jgi:MFS transporter, ACS family, allantoate permease
MAYADTQAHGFAAIFGMVQDLKLFVVKLVDGKPSIDTTKYQLSSGMTTLGAVAVSIYPR